VTVGRLEIERLKLMSDLDRSASAFHQIPARFAGPRLLRMVLANKPTSSAIEPAKEDLCRGGASSISRQWRIGSRSCVVPHAPMIEAIRTHVMGAERIAADHATGPVPVIEDCHRPDLYLSSR
jgi:hypothetical protein